ncbi:carbohydrate ABC transporter permease [Paenibacillus alkalitolerans]|uniref:carbohydrate ABC transporter permease n=1 Tax=Paenibacillus alkalitolerans TaxID=2799335 RepID=UPI0018F64276|nr:carbohydrate ABC transporter permease [Paenibacillus alkalitolerans]
MIKESAGDRLLLLIFYIFMGGFALYCLVPFLTVISSSITSEGALVKYGYSLIPREISLDAYKLLLSDDVIFNAYGVTIFVTCVGTILGMILTCAMAYGISVKSVKYRNHVAFYVFFAMLFKGGLVPTYILISKYLHMKDTIWVLIIPGLLNPWNMFLLRNFFNTIDDALAESAKIDGANDIYILFRIILPVSLPAIATISLFYALAFWNEWFRAMLFISNENLHPLQYLVMKVVRNLDFANQISDQVTIPGYIIPSNTTRLATAVVTIGPIIFLYPFLQKYFVKGLMVGSVKG